MKWLKFAFLFWVLTGRALLIAESSANSPPIIAPSGKFTITQTYVPGDVYVFTSEVSFFDPQFKNTILEPSDFNWAADYYISPDEKWILRIQKTGSGDNTTYLYRVQNDGSISETRPELGDSAWDFYDKHFKPKGAGYYHKGFKFVEWISAKYLVISLEGTSLDHSRFQNLSDFRVRYNLKDGTFRKD